MNFSIILPILSVNFNLSLQLNLPNINGVASETREVFYHEQTAVIIDFNDKNQTIRCEVIEI